MTDKQLLAITKHGNNLLAIFPNAIERDPVRLCKKLRIIEARAHAVALRLCNGPEYPGGADEVDKITDAIMDVVNKLLGNNTVEGEQVDYHGNVYGTVTERAVPVFINRDPRGYALKITNEYMERNAPCLHRDWGNYGILAPEIDRDGN